MSELDDAERIVAKLLAANMRHVTERIERQLFCSQTEPRERPLPPNVIEISAVCGEIRVLMVDEVAPHYLIRLMQIPMDCEDPSTWTAIPEVRFFVRSSAWWNGVPSWVFQPPDGHKITLGFHRDAELSRLRIRLLVDGIQYELNGAAPEKMQPVRELPGPAGLLAEGEHA
jgi:hypothetical protein